MVLLIKSAAEATTVFAILIDASGTCPSRLEFLRDVVFLFEREEEEEESGEGFSVRANDDASLSLVVLSILSERIEAPSSLVVISTKTSTVVAVAAVEVDEVDATFPSSMRDG